MQDVTIQQMWETYKNIHSHAPNSYEACAFGDSPEMADELAQLVLAGNWKKDSNNV